MKKGRTIYQVCQAAAESFGMESSWFEYRFMRQYLDWIDPKDTSRQRDYADQAEQCKKGVTRQKGQPDEEYA